MMPRDAVIFSFTLVPAIFILPEVLMIDLHFKGTFYQHSIRLHETPEHF